MLVTQQQARHSQLQSELFNLRVINDNNKKIHVKDININKKTSPIGR